MRISQLDPQEETLDIIAHHLDLAETAILLMQAVIKDQALKTIGDSLKEIDHIDEAQHD